MSDDINKGRYYSHQLPPYAYDWHGWARNPDRTSGQGMSGYAGYASDPGSEDNYPGNYIATGEYTNSGSLYAGVVALTALHGYLRGGKRSFLSAALWGVAAVIAPIPAGGIALYETVKKR